MVDFNKLSRRIKGRSKAKALLELAMDDVKNLDSDAQYGFWDEILDAVPEEIKKPKPEKKTKSGPMDDEDARIFSGMKMEFGQYKGREIGDISLRYLDWLVGESESFIKRLARYLKNDKVAERLRQELKHGG